MKSSNVYIVSTDYLEIRAVLIFCNANQFVLRSMNAFVGTVMVLEDNNLYKRLSLEYLASMLFFIQAPNIPRTSSP